MKPNLSHSNNNAKQRTKYVEELPVFIIIVARSLFECRMMECQPSGNAAFAACEDRLKPWKRETDHESDGEEEKTQ